MTKYALTVVRHETWSRKTEVEAPTLEAAITELERKLDDGWAAVFGTSDGEYQECWTEIFKPTEVNAVDSQAGQARVPSSGR